MDPTYQQLVENLDSLVKVYRSLLDVVRQERDILVSAKIEDLNENNKSKDAILLRIRSLENSRMKSARDLASAVGADVETPRLLDIATRMSGEKADRLRSLHSVLELLIRRVSEVNKSNEDLVRSALTNVSGAMESIKGSLQTKKTYERKGALVTTKSDNGHLISKDV